MGYLFVDRILEVEAGAGPWRAHGLKVVRRADPFLRRGPGGIPELSPCFAGEAVGQLAAWVAMSLSGFTRRPVAGLTAEVEVNRPARAGESLALRVEIESLEEDAVHYHGRASSRGETLVQLRHSVGPMLPMEGFDDPREVERQFQALLRPGGEAPGEGLFEEWAAEDPSGPGGELPGALHPAIDRVLEREPDRLLAVTCVTRNAPYLRDHFPRDPVLPLSLLLDGQVLLARQLCGGERGPEAARVARLRDLKMRDFVRPGTKLLSEVRLRERRPGSATVELTGRVEGRVLQSGLVDLVEVGAA